MKKHFRVKIYGTVQGVGFRFRTQQEACGLGLHGFVRNDPDGGVYIEVEGDTESLQRFFFWCEHGPRSSSVLKVEKEEGELQNLDDFEIRY